MPTMVKRCRCSREETRTRIVQKADEFFHKYGFDRTTVADIASALGMSSANVYKFFPTKRALIEATANLCLTEMREVLERASKSRRNTAERIEAVIFSIFQYNHKKNKFDYEFYRFVVQAYQDKWDCIRNFEELKLKAITDVLEDGVKRGEVNVKDTLGTAKVILSSVAWIVNPVLFYELQGNDVEDRLHAQVQFFERALR